MSFLGIWFMVFVGISGVLLFGGLLLTLGIYASVYSANGELAKATLCIIAVAVLLSLPIAVGTYISDARKNTNIQAEQPKATANRRSAGRYTLVYASSLATASGRGAAGTTAMPRLPAGTVPRRSPRKATEAIPGACLGTLEPSRAM